MVIFYLAEYIVKARFFDEKSSIGVGDRLENRLARFLPVH